MMPMMASGASGCSFSNTILPWNFAGLHGTKRHRNRARSSSHWRPESSRADYRGDTPPASAVLSEPPETVIKPKASQDLKERLRAKRLEYEAAGIDWPTPHSLDLLQLVTVLDPALESASLDALADFWGVENRGRHTALGDALVTAEIFRVLLPRLADLGVHTLGDANDFCGRATTVIRRQTAMGWSR